MEILPSKLFSEVDRKYFEALLENPTAFISPSYSKTLFFACF